MKLINDLNWNGRKFEYVGSKQISNLNLNLFFVGEIQPHSSILSVLYELDKTLRGFIYYE